MCFRVERLSDLAIQQHDKRNEDQVNATTTAERRRKEEESRCNPRQSEDGGEGETAAGQEEREGLEPCEQEASEKEVAEKDLAVGDEELATEEQGQEQKQGEQVVAPGADEGVAM